MFQFIALILLALVSMFNSIVSTLNKPLKYWAAKAATGYHKRLDVLAKDCDGVTDLVIKRQELAEQMYERQLKRIEQQAKDELLAINRKKAKTYTAYLKMKNI